MKVKIFIDFWNLQLSWNEYHERLGTFTPVTNQAIIVWTPRLIPSAVRAELVEA